MDTEPSSPPVINSHDLHSANPIPSSSPAFRTQTPLPKPAAPVISSVLPILLPPTSLRPLAFRTFTKKHNLTLTSSALQSLATFIGKHCGAGWREEGLAEAVLEEVAKSWKKGGGGVIVEGDGEHLAGILKTISGCMVGGKLIPGKTLSRQTSFALGGDSQRRGSSTGQYDPPRPAMGRDDSQTSFGFSELALAGAGVEEDDEEHSMDPRSWLKVVGAFEQPKVVYNMNKRQFENDTTKQSMLAPASHKTHLFHYRYNMIHQRILRNEAFQRPSFNQKNHIPSLQRSASSMVTLQNTFKITPIASMLGRSGSPFLLLGLLSITPTGQLAISDLTGSIVLDLRRAKAVPDEGLWFTPGMFVLVDGIYEDEGNTAGGVLDNSGGVGGTIGGKFTGHLVRSPPCERRAAAPGVSGNNHSDAESHMVQDGGGLGWVDLLGVGSERAMGSKMRRIEKRVFNHINLDHHHPLESPTVDHSSSSRSKGRIAFLSDVHLDSPPVLEGLKQVLLRYESQLSDSSGSSSPPIAIIIMGHFSQHAILGNHQSGDPVDYKESFDSLASVLSEVPLLLQNTSFVFIPSDHDPWASAFSMGSSTILPRRGIPEMFTSRVKRVFQTANAQVENMIPGGGGGGQKNNERGGGGGKAIWTTNPSRLSLFGPVQEIVLFRDNMLERLRRNAIHFPSSFTTTNNHDDEQPSTSTRTSSHQTDSQPVHHGDTVDVEDMEIDIDTPVLQQNTQEEEDNPIIGKNIIQENKKTAYSLSKTILNQGYLSPFSLSIRPVLWDYVSSLHLYPLPTVLVLADPEAPPFAMEVEGCWVVNPGCLLEGFGGLEDGGDGGGDGGKMSGKMGGGRTGGMIVRWAEWDAEKKMGRVEELELELRK
ncbi:MAG: GTPase-activating protein [Watsoniomyces obsoletus]|nr:MAG: GTPase-activating protein [Watsoniomyces obsoletus]